MMIGFAGLRDLDGQRFFAKWRKEMSVPRKADGSNVEITPHFNRQSKIENLKSQIENLKSQIENLKSQIENRQWYVDIPRYPDHRSGPLEPEHVHVWEEYGLVVHERCKVCGLVREQ